MVLNESELRELIALRQLDICALDIEQVFIWVAKHLAAKKHRRELHQYTSHLFQYEILNDVRRKMKECKIRLLRSFLISISVMSKIKDSIEQIIGNVDVGMFTAKHQSRIKRYQQELAEHSLGRAWLIAFKRVNQLDEDISAEKQNVRAAIDDFEEAIQLHENKTQKLKDDIQRIATKQHN